MDELIGPLKYKGSFKDIRHYKLPSRNNIYAATKGVITKAIYDTNPAFINNRIENYEFVAKTKLAKNLHLAMGDWAQPIVNRFFQGEMTSIMNDVMDLGPVKQKGHRDILLSQHKNLLYLMNDYYYYKPLAEIMRCPYTVVEMGQKRSVSVVVKGLFPLKQIKAPDKATHFQIWLNIGCVKDYRYFEEYENYFSYLPPYTCRRKKILSAWIPVEGGPIDDITLTISLPDIQVLTDNETIVRTFGIVFGRMIEEVVLLKKDRGSIVFLGPA